MARDKLCREIREHSCGSGLHVVALALPVGRAMTDPFLAALRRVAAGVLLAAACASSACDERLKDLNGPTSPNLQPAFSSIQAEIFENTDLAGRTSCVTCHTDQGRTPAGNLNLRADPYAALVNAPSRARAGAVFVVPGNPDGSYLIEKLKDGGNISGLRMPRNGPPFLTDNQILVIRRWIETGAPRN
jgi:mono/diheme cytochrome c family protein